MKIKYLLLSVIFAIATSNNCFATQEKKYNVGLCIAATGKYIQFVPPLLESARKYFLPQHNVTFFIFTDGTLPNSPDTVVIPQKKLGWPYDTLLRFEMYLKQKNLLSEMDYIYATDADMLFVDYFGDEILGELVGTNHPGFIGKYSVHAKEISYENNPISTAYVAPDEGTLYFAGGFYGGKTEQLFVCLEHILKNIYIDLQKNYTARYHDESHLNRYFIDYPPKIVLDRSYCYPEDGMEINYPPCKPKLLALTKKHDELRE